MAADRALESDPRLTATDRDRAFALFQAHFRDTPEADPPVSENPAEDDLLLAIWDVIVDRETEGADDPELPLEEFYANTFAALAGGKAQEPTVVPPPESLPPPPPLAASAAPAPAPDLPVYHLKITLEDSQPSIWRRILVEKGTTLSNLHHVVQSAMGWSESHMHAFYAGDEPLGDPQLKDAMRQVGDTLRYVYDFGSSWELTLELEEVTDRESNRSYPLCVAGRRATPPEDIGGMSGYREMLEILKDPKHDDYNEMARWLTQDFHPASFNIDQANIRLKRHGKAGFTAVV